MMNARQRLLEYAAQRCRFHGVTSSKPVDAVLNDVIAAAVALIQDADDPAAQHVDDALRAMRSAFFEVSECVSLEDDKRDQMAALDDWAANKLREHYGSR
jgi:hypothetical protein